MGFRPPYSASPSSPFYIPFFQIFAPGTLALLGNLHPLSRTQNLVQGVRRECDLHATAFMRQRCLLSRFSGLVQENERENTCDSVLATAWLCTIFCTIVQNFFLVGSRDLGSAPASLRLIKPPFLELFFTIFCSVLAPKHIPPPFRGSARKPIFHARATPVSLAGNMPRFVHRGDGEFEGKRGRAHVSRHGGWYLFVPRPTAFSSGFAVFLAGFLHGLRIIAYAFSEKEFTPHTTFFFFILASGEGASR